MQRLALFAVGSILLAGCPGTLSDPNAFSGGGTGGAGGSPGPTVQAVLAVNCGNSVCHDADQPAAGLDLVSPDVASRTVNVNSSDGSCSSEILVVAGDPDASYLVKKILASPGICGGQMPIGNLLDIDDTAVIQDWIVDLGMASESIDEGSEGGV